MSIFRRFLDKACVPETQRHVFRPLSTEFKVSKKDMAQSEEESKEIQRQYNIDYPACVGCLIYLSYKRTDIIYTVNKLAKFNRKPGKYHMDSIVHLLRYLRDSPYQARIGCRFKFGILFCLSICKVSKIII